MDDALRNMIEETFSDFIVEERNDSRSWYLCHDNRNRRSHWFRVTWIPGHVMITGDLGEITFSVYGGGFSTVERTVSLVNGACSDYLLGKSTIKQAYNSEKSVEDLIDFAKEEYEYGETSIWKKLYELFCSWSGDFDVRDVKTPEGQKRIEERVRIYSHEITQQDIYELCIDDYYGSYSWSDGDMWYPEALKIWAKLVSEKELKNE